MCNKTGNTPDDDAFFGELWLQKLPQDVQFLLAPAQDMPIECVTVMADHSMQYRQPSVAAVTPTVPSATSVDGLFQAFIEKLNGFNTDRNSRGAHFSGKPQSSNRRTSKLPNDSQKLCWYHARYGKDAAKCIHPCLWKGQPPSGKD
ncbi:unnamed protein product [Echinostoma caproni]|uniref:Nanos-type domain-containing protein n=1 Tax=Echinostoma caproni TaxID=27848 RepID=A0A183ACH7_9TREM|nr:unnamed protein product [Echinostoma caproni]